MIRMEAKLFWLFNFYIIVLGLVYGLGFAFFLTNNIFFSWQLFFLSKASLSLK